MVITARRKTESAGWSLTRIQQRLCEESLLSMQTVWQFSKSLMVCLKMVFIGYQIIISIIMYIGRRENCFMNGVILPFVPF